MYPLTALLFLVPFVLAVPAPAPQTDATTTAAAPAPESTDITHLYICTDATFKGQCTNLHLEVSTCRKFIMSGEQEDERETGEGEPMKRERGEEEPMIEE